MELKKEYLGESYLVDFKDQKSEVTKLVKLNKAFRTEINGDKIKITLIK